MIVAQAIGVGCDISDVRILCARFDSHNPMAAHRLTSLGHFRLQNAQLARAHVEAMNHAILIVAIKGIAIAWIEQHVKSVRTSEWYPIGIPDTFFAPGCARSDPIGIVLQS